jgi:CRP-like cAMP-binding protein
VTSDATNEPYNGGNRLIDCLPPADRDAVSQRLTMMTADEASTGISRGERITAAYFPIDAVFSVLVEVDGGNCYEVDSVGGGGFIGGELLFGVEVASRSVVCQIGGRFAQMPVAAFEQSMGELPAFNAAIHRALLLQWYRAQQTIACNFAHSLLERCARWAALTHDAVARAEFTFRAEYLSMMLGEQTHVVAEPMAALEAIGAIRYADDVVTILSDRRLREAACECYAAPVEYGKHLAARQVRDRKGL